MSANDTKIEQPSPLPSTDIKAIKTEGAPPKPTHSPFIRKYNNIYTTGWRSSLEQYQAEAIKSAQERFPDIFTDEKLDHLHALAEADEMGAYEDHMECAIDDGIILIHDYIIPMVKVAEGTADVFTKERLHSKGAYDDYIPPTSTDKYTKLASSLAFEFKEKTGHELEINSNEEERNTSTSSQPDEVEMPPLMPRDTDNDIYTTGWKQYLLKSQAEQVKEAQERFPNFFTDEKLDYLFRRAHKLWMSKINRFHSSSDVYAVFMETFFKPAFSRRCQYVIDDGLKGLIRQVSIEYAKEKEAEKKEDGNNSEDDDEK